MNPSTPLAIASTALFALPLVPALVFAFETVTPGRRAGSRPAATGPRPSCAVLVPAHDEAAGIAATLERARAQLTPGDRVVVVADNCTDDTAERARAAGAEVVERRDAVLRGKGYALDFGVRYLAAAPPQVVVILDADCELGAGSLDTLVRECAATGRPVQALYLMQPPPAAGLKQKIAAFAWIVKNQARPGGAARWGLPCQLMGTGMAFPWRVIVDAPLATGHVVEDMELGLEMARRGTPTIFCADALVSSQFPTHEAGERSQRRRWEHGHLDLLFRRVPSLLLDSVRSFDPRLLALSLDLSVPPLALLVATCVGLSVIGAILWWLVGNPGPFVVTVSALGLVGVGTFVSWFRYGRNVVSLGELVSAPIYVVAKLPLYFGFFKSQQVEWVRTKRDDDA